MKGKAYTVKLADGTVGKIDYYSIDGDIKDFIGEKLSVHLYDEYGDPFEKTGIIVEVMQNG